MANWEVETLTLTKDTSEADIKQRREIVDGRSYHTLSIYLCPILSTNLLHIPFRRSVVFVDQAPVRAAIFGRLLLLDGIDKAERNVLPTLNNLLENREMALEDGRFLSLRPSSSSSSSSTTSVMVTVHPLFRVAAIGSPVPPYPGRPLDPPLRSRFQVKIVFMFVCTSFKLALTYSYFTRLSHVLWIVSVWTPCYNASTHSYALTNQLRPTVGAICRV